MSQATSDRIAVKWTCAPATDVRTSRQTASNWWSDYELVPEVEYIDDTK